MMVNRFSWFCKKRKKKEVTKLNKFKIHLRNHFPGILGTLNLA